MAKLYIPGPTEVTKDILSVLSTPQIGHRTDDFRKLFSSLKPGLKEIFGTKNDVLISTSTGSGFWEAAIRNCVRRNVLHAVNGAFSNKWSTVSRRCGRNVDTIKFLPGSPVNPDKLRMALKRKKYDAFCMVHCETSTGVVSNLDDISSVMRDFPEVLFFVDAVSSVAGMPIDADKHRIDVCLASSQKAFALPAGISFASISSGVYKRAEKIKFRGYYFDFLELKKMYDKDMTPYTPSIPHLYALQEQLKRIKIEGLSGRYKRHRRMAEYTRNWAVSQGFSLFAKQGFRSDTVSCICNTKDVDFVKIKKDMAKKGYMIDSGYSKLNMKLIEHGKLPTFRIAHMGDLALDDIKTLTKELEKYW